MERADPRFVAAVNLAYALMPCERGEILGALPQVSELMNALSQPLSNSASEALAIGSLVLPAVEAALFVLKSKLPKKQNTQINQQISLPLRETFKKLIAQFETSSSDNSATNINELITETILQN